MDHIPGILHTHNPENAFSDETLHQYIKPRHQKPRRIKHCQHCQFLLHSDYMLIITKQRYEIVNCCLPGLVIVVHCRYYVIFCLFLCVIPSVTFLSEICVIFSFQSLTSTHLNVNFRIYRIHGFCVIHVTRFVIFLFH